MNQRNVFRIAGLGVMLPAFLLYVAIVTSFAYPNEWSSALYSILGFDPFRPLSRPVWQLVMSSLGWLFGNNVVVAANVFSAVMGAGCVFLTYHLGARIRMTPKLMRTDEEKQRFVRTRVVSGLVAASFLAVCAPMIAVSSRLNPFPMDLCLLLAAALLSVLYRDHPKNGYWFGFAAVYGIGITEFSTFILLGPVFFCWWVWMFWRAPSLRWTSVLTGLGIAVLGASIGLLFCLHYARSPVAEWREFDSFWVVLKYFLLDHYQQIRFAVPKQGWLIVLLTMVFPAVFIAWNGIEQADDIYTNIGLYSFRIVLVAVAVLILFNLPGSPWKVLGPSVVLVTPYTITALWFGQLGGFFYDRLSAPTRKRSREKAVSPFPSRLLLAGWAVVVVVAGGLNLARANPSQAEPLVELSRDVLHGMGNQQYLISNGMLDSMIQWEAMKQGNPVRLINRSRAGSRAYMKFLTTWFENPAMESMAEIGFQPFLDVWMSGDPNITEHLAIQDVPDFWTLQGYHWIPASGKYIGVSVAAGAPGVRDQMLKDSYDFALRHVGTLGADANRPELLREIFRAAGNHLSVFANNLGYHLVEWGRGADAEAAYELSLRYNPNNVSALINLADLARTAGRDEEADTFKDHYEKILKGEAASMNARSLAFMFGQIRNPVMFMQQGVALIRSGLTDVGVDRLREAMALQPENPSIEFALAQSLFDEGQIQASYEQFVRITEQNPSEASAWLGLARCQLLLGKVSDAGETYRRLEAMGLPDDQLAMERGFMYLKNGQFTEAIPVFQQGLLNEKLQGPSAVGLIVAAIKLNQRELIGHALPVLKSRPEYFSGQMMLYQLAMASGNPVAARESLTNARRIQPGNVDVLEKSIRLELFEGREEDAKALLDRLLSVDFNNAFGNYLLSGIHEKNGRLDLAEVALRRALPRDLPGDAHYGLAWILEKQGRYDEALAVIDVALERQPNNPSFIGVKGIIKSKQQAWNEAEILLKKAIEIETVNAVHLFTLHLASVYTQVNRLDEARQLIDELTPKEPSFLPEEKEMYRSVLAKLAERTAISH